MRVVLIFDQGLAGAGGKSNPNLSLTAVKGGVGSALMMEPHFKKIDAEVIATLYCGNQYFLDNQEDVVTKMTAMVKKLAPDFVVCGPCFNFLDYGLMSAMIAESILENTDISACAMMSQENEKTIKDYCQIVPIIKMPKKGGTGLNDSFSRLCSFMDASVNNKNEVKNLKEKVCY